MCENLKINRSLFFLPLICRQCSTRPKLNSAKSTLMDSREINDVIVSRLDNFIENTGAIVLECGNYISITNLLDQYFQNKPPFAETGNKKSEFPDAIVLLATESWAKEEGIQVLAVASDKDWKNYCDTSANIDYIEDLANALSKFNKATAPFAFLSFLTSQLREKEDSAIDFVERIHNNLEMYFDGFTPDQEADSYHQWEPDGCHGWLSDFELTDYNFNIIDHSEDYIVLKMSANISVEVEGEFSLSHYDSIDRDYVNIGGVTTTTEAQFNSEILVTISGDLNGDLSNLEIEEVEVVNPIASVDFGTLEPDYSDDE
ncbi:PIN domain-containing protein [Psychrobacter sp. CAM01]|uniref:PIN domain-containing protein n=1 Tax=Psychrobacter sp. CAM01 TaxID=3080335 RepID=UPI0029367B70|nr:PIN domain-containing protein [Psychrobacter sp. CAM01]MDV2860675.1 PIN domain-containing protein [Psychrobacter sp. CAM01]